MKSYTLHRGEEAAELKVKLTHSQAMNLRDKYDELHGGSHNQQSLYLLKYFGRAFEYTLGTTADFIVKRPCQVD